MFLVYLLWGDTNGRKCDYLLWDDEHSDQKQSDVDAAHHLGVFHQAYPFQDGLIICAVEQTRTSMPGLRFQLHISYMITNSQATGFTVDIRSYLLQLEQPPGRVWAQRKLP